MLYPSTQQTLSGVAASVTCETLSGLSGLSLLTSQELYMLYAIKGRQQSELKAEMKQVMSKWRRQLVR